MDKYVVTLGGPMKCLKLLSNRVNAKKVPLGREPSECFRSPTGRVKSLPFALDFVSSKQPCVPPLLLWLIAHVIDATFPHFADL